MANWVIEQAINRRDSISTINVDIVNVVIVNTGR